MNWKIAVPIAVVVIALVAALSGMSGRKAPEMAVVAPEVVLVPTASPEAPVTESPAPVSGNVDDLAVSLIGEADKDLTFTADADEDMALLTSDGASLNGYTTAYDETTF